MIKPAILFVVSLFLCLSANGQSFQNPSFEDEPADATMPMGWFACERGTTPDILPGYWGVYTEPSEGDSYVGLITRENGSFESISQRISPKIASKHCYRINIDLAVSDNYTGYNNPVRLRVWLTDKKCDKKQMIFESPLIDHTEWETYQMEFEAEQTGKYLILEAFHKEGNQSYKGNILIDNISPILICGRA